MIEEKSDGLTKSIPVIRPFDQSVWNRQRGFRADQSQRGGDRLGADTHWVCVPPGRDTVTVRSFGCFTPDLQAMAEWLKQCGVTSVAMEATGVYWIPVFQILETAGFEVCLVNPYPVKLMPGRKSDVQDCQWYQQLHSYGLLAGSFRPEDQVCIAQLSPALSKAAPPMCSECRKP